MRSSFSWRAFCNASLAIFARVRHDVRHTGGGAGGAAAGTGCDGALSFAHRAAAAALISARVFFGIFNASGFLSAFNDFSGLSASFKERHAGRYGRDLFKTCMLTLAPSSAPHLLVHTMVPECNKMHTINNCNKQIHTQTTTTTTQKQTTTFESVNPKK